MLTIKRDAMRATMLEAITEQAGPDSVFFAEEGKTFMRFDRITVEFDGMRPTLCFSWRGTPTFEQKLDELTPGGNITISGISGQTEFTFR